jgi:hypothetical protein
MQKALSLFEKGPLALVAGRDLNPRPLGYEHYDARLPRLRCSGASRLPNSLADQVPAPAAPWFCSGRFVNSITAILAGAEEILPGTWRILPAPSRWG